jgi:ATP-binding cassette subfamily F protein 3
MPFVQCSNINLAFGARDLILAATMYLADGSRAALAGPNGAGKSTLMKIAAGLLKPDSGERVVTKGARISYLPQTDVIFGNCTVYEEAEKAYEFADAMLARQDEIGRQLESPEIDERSTERLLSEHSDLATAVDATGYYRRKERVSEVLLGLGFRQADLEKRVSELSGGWQMRLALAKILLEDPDVMLLDEPTNYLDLEARNWLEKFLGDYRGGVLLVSHDRYFLDKTVREVYELFNGKLTRYPGTYSQYEIRRSRELEAVFEAWERQQEEIQKLEDFIRRFRYKESKASQVQSRVKMLEKIVPITIPEGMKKIHFSFPAPPRSGKVPVRLEGLTKSYGDFLVIDKLDLEIERGSKVAFVGPNGAGKTTLMRILAGIDTKYSGKLSFGSGVEIGYFSQDSTELMDMGNTVEGEVGSVCPNDLFPKLRNLLGAFLFRGDDLEKPISVLSGGERSRLALLKMLLHPANLYILDEPTNHLDLTSKDVLLDALKSFDGTVLFVSHDRGFIEELANKVLELEAGKTPRLYYGDYAYYLEKKAAIESAALISGTIANAANGSAGDSLSRNAVDAAISSNSSQTKDRDAEKAKRNRIKKLRIREEEILARLDEISKAKKDVEKAIALPVNYQDGHKVKQLLAKSKELDGESQSLDSEWVAVAQELSDSGAES